MELWCGAVRSPGEIDSSLLCLALLFAVLTAWCLCSCKHDIKAADESAEVISGLWGAAAACLRGRSTSRSTSKSPISAREYGCVVLTIAPAKRAHTIVPS